VNRVLSVVEFESKSRERPETDISHFRDHKVFNAQMRDVI